MNIIKSIAWLLGKITAYTILFLPMLFICMLGLQLIWVVFLIPWWFFLYWLLFT